MLRTLFRPPITFFFFFNDTATTEIYTLSLHDALPISRQREPSRQAARPDGDRQGGPRQDQRQHRKLGGRVEHRVSDRKSTRLNSSHLVISYAVFCLKKKKKESLGVLITPSKAIVVRRL